MKDRKCCFYFILFENPAPELTVKKNSVPATNIVGLALGS